MSATTSQPRVRGGTDVADVVLIVVGAVQVLLGLLAFFAPGTFYESVGPFPPENGHFIKDIGSWQVALGAAALYAARRPSWRAPMLGFLALQFILHAVSHVIDVGDTDPEWNGPATLAATAFGAVVLTAFFVRERRR